MGPHRNILRIIPGLHDRIRSIGILRANLGSHLELGETHELAVGKVIAEAAGKFAHVFENHKHEVCIDSSTTHFHTLDLECEFYKFKVNSEFTFNSLHFEEIIPFQLKPLIASKYLFLSSYRKLHFSLRGPPIYS